MLEQSPVTSLRGVGEKRSALLAKLGLTSLADTLFFYPRRYEDRRYRTPLKKIVEQGIYTVVVNLADVQCLRTSRPAVFRIVATASDTDGTARVLWFGGRALLHSIPVGRPVLLYGRAVITPKGAEFLNPDCELYEPENKGKSWGSVVPVYPATAGLSPRWVRNFMRDALQAALTDLEDPLPPEIREKRGLLPFKEAIWGIHFPTSRSHWAQARMRLAYQECYDYQQQMNLFREKIKKEAPAVTLSGNTPLLSSFINRLPYRLTDSQQNAIAEILADLALRDRMNRLLQGDVGSGKTVVAVAVAFMVLNMRYNVALLAPTTLLASQLHQVAESLISPFGMPCLLLTGSTSEKDRERMDVVLEKGGAMLVGTHALISEKVRIPRLGLVIIDEQHRFGVRQRGALADNGTPHILTMSGTPIPRTLNLSLYGGIPISILGEKPSGRKSVATQLADLQEIEAIKTQVYEEIETGGQVYWVCPSIDADMPEAFEEACGVLSVEERFRDLKKDKPKLKIALLHGRMSPEEKEATLKKFFKGSTQLLVSTTVIEVGVDVPNATVMLVEGAGRFGLAQLHQLRGRVGRGERRALCILIDRLENPKTRERLEILENCSDGFQIAQEDLKLRQAGDIKGTRQHGIPQFRLLDLDRDQQLLSWVAQDIHP